MSYQIDDEKTKTILTNLNKTDIPFDIFYDQLEKEFGNKISFSKLKQNFENFYGKFPKMDLYYILNKVKIDSTGTINISQMMIEFGEVLGIQIPSYKLTFYTIAEKLQREIKVTTIEYIFKQNLNLSSELNSDQFYTHICQPLKIENHVSNVAFKSLDIDKNGIVNIENFIMVIDSYRDDLRGKNILEENKENIQNNSEKSEQVSEKSAPIKQNIKNLNEKMNDSKIFWVNKFCFFIKSINLTEKMIYDASKKLETSEEINLDSLKRKLKILSNDRLSAIELNNISDSFDINNNKFINYNDYLEVINYCVSNEKFNILFQNNQNTYALYDYYISKNKNKIKELPFRTNKNFVNKIKSVKKVEKDKDKKKAKTNQFAMEENLVGTNLSGTNYKEPKASKKVINNKEVPVQNKSNLNNLFEFFKQLDVFESGEWSLIDLLENFYLTEGEENSPCLDLFDLLKKKYCPSIDKKQLYNLLLFIDVNTDGYFNYLDIILFLLKYLNYKSSKLGWKEVSRSIIYTKNISVDDFFNKKIPLKNSEIVSFVEFTKIICSSFDIMPPVAKQMFEDLQNLLSNHKITKGDIIDTVNRQYEYDKKNKNIPKSTPISEIDISISRNRSELIIDKIKKESSKNKYIKGLNKKTFEEEMKRFVRELQKAFVLSYDNSPKETFSKNLSSFLHLPNTIKLSQFRDLFIKPLSMNFALGIATFNLVREMIDNKINCQNDINNDILISISKDALMKLLVPYFDPNISEFDLKSFLFYLENGKYPLIKYCFESLDYNSNGVILIDLYRMIESFYPNIPKTIIKNIIECIDVDRRGKTTYKALANFLYNYSSKGENKISNDLILKHFAYVYDKKKVNTYKYLERVLVKENLNPPSVTFEQHTNMLVNMGFNLDQSDSLFLFLSDIPQEKAYTLKKLADLIDSIRTVKEEPFMDSDMNKEDNKNISAKSENQIISEFLDSLNNVLPLCKFLCKFKIDQTTLSISSIEFNKLLIDTYSDKVSINKGILKNNIIKQLDNDYSGLIKYTSLHNFLKTYLPSPNYEGCHTLHLQYWAYQSFSDFNSKWDDYELYKGLIKYKYMSYQNFETNFLKEECLKDKNICKICFDFLKEKTGDNKNMVHVQKLIGYLKSITHSEEKEKDKELILPSINGFSLSEEDCMNIVIESIKKIEEIDEGDFTSVFNEINMGTEVNSFGKINWENMKRILFNKFSFDSRQLYAYDKVFCKVPSLFDLFKLCQICQDISKHQINDYTKIKNKIAKKIDKKLTIEETCLKFNLSCYTGLTSNSFVVYCNAIFGLKSYESLILFLSFWNKKNNPEIDKMKVSIYYIMFRLKMLKCFKKEKMPVINDAMTPILNLAFDKLFSYLNKLEGFKCLFEEYDLNHNNLLERNEFLTLLNSFNIEGLNEDMKIRIVNYLDKNNDGVINYNELFEFMEKHNSPKNK